MLLQTTPNNIIEHGRRKIDNLDLRLSDEQVLSIPKPVDRSISLCSDISVISELFLFDSLRVDPTKTNGSSSISLPEAQSTDNLDLRLISDEQVPSIPKLVQRSISLSSDISVVSECFFDTFGVDLIKTNAPPNISLPEAQSTDNFDLRLSEQVLSVPKPVQRSISLCSDISIVSEVLFDTFGVDPIKTNGQPILEPQTAKSSSLGLGVDNLFEIPDSAERAHICITGDVNSVSRAKSLQAEDWTPHPLTHPDTSRHLPAFSASQRQPELLSADQFAYSSKFCDLSIDTHNEFKSKATKRRSESPTLTPGSSRKRVARNMWTAEEDQRLRDAVKQVGVALNWRTIAALVQTRTDNQCAQRWRKSLRPELARVVKGAWDDEEDARLRQLVTALGKTCTINWENISSGMEWRRCPKQCRERWRKFLDPSLKFGGWTEAEDAKLMSLFEQHPRKWAKIAKQLPGRTAGRVKRRHQLITRGNSVRRV